MHQVFDGFFTAVCPPTTYDTTNTEVDALSKYRTQSLIVVVALHRMNRSHNF